MAVIICLNTVVAGYAAGPPAAGTINRSRDVLEQDEVLRQQIEQEKKFFVEKIVLKGASKLSEKEIKDIIAPFEGNWLTNKDIRHITDSLKAAYVKKGIETSHLKTTYEIQETSTLKIHIKF